MEPFPEDVARFMFDHVESIDQLEILRVLGEDPRREWDAVTLAAEVQASPQAVRGHLTSLHARGLLAIRAQGADVSCRYGVTTPDLDGMVNRLLRLYEERPVTMIKMIYDRAKDPLRDFTDAFRVRKKEG